MGTTGIDTRQKFPPSSVQADRVTETFKRRTLQPSYGSLKTSQLLGAYTTLYCALWHIKAKDYDNKLERILFGGQINDFP